MTSQDSHNPQDQTQDNNPCSNPEPHKLGSLPCCEGLIVRQPRDQTQADRENLYFDIHKVVLSEYYDVNDGSLDLPALANDPVMKLIDSYANQRALSLLDNITDLNGGLFSLDPNYGKPSDDPDDGKIKLSADDAHEWIEAKRLNLTGGEQ